MDIPRYRIGNDLTVLWAINNNDGTPYDLSGKEVRLYVTNERGISRVEPTIVQGENSSVTNIIRWVFLGDNQKVLGKHTLTVEILTSDEHRKIKRDICDAFTLVSRSEEEETGGEGNALDSGAIYLSTKLDVYRFGIVRVEIGTNGNWFIDGTDTGRSAMGGGPGLVHNIFNVDDLGKEFVKDSVIDTFNAYTINEIYKSLQNISFRDLAGLDLKDLDECDVIAYIGESWVNVPFKDLLSIYGGGNSGGGGSGDSHWYLGNDGKIHTDYDIVVHGNAIIEGDTSSGGEGEDNPVGLDEQAVLDLLEREGYVTEDDIAGLIPEVDLSDYYTTTQVDDLLSKKVNASDVYTKEDLADYKSWWDKLMAHITVDENGNVVIDPNLMVVGDVASGGEGEDVVIGGISGVKVNGVTYYDDNGDGIVDLGTISGGGGVSGDYLPLSGGTITGDLVLSSTNAARSLRFNTTSGSSWLFVNAGEWYVTNLGWGAEYKLIHSGNIGSQSVNQVYSNSDGNGAFFGSRKDAIGSGGGATIWTYGVENPLTIHTNGVERLRVSGGGNVGIGTTNPQYNLDVNGTIRVGGIHTANTPQILFAYAGDYFDVNGNFVLGPNSRSWNIFDQLSTNVLFSVERPTGNTTIKGNLIVSDSVTTSLLKSSVGLDIVANGSAAGSRLYLTSNCFRPWSDDNELIDLGASSMRWRNIYGVKGIFTNVDFGYKSADINSAGWKKVAVDNKYSTYSSVIITIQRNYNTINNEVYTFLINCAYYHQTTITQIGGRANGKIITQIAVYNPPSPYDRAIYIYYNGSAVNGVYVSCIGDFDAINPEEATLPSSNVTKMDTSSNGFATTGNMVVEGDVASA